MIHEYIKDPSSTEIGRPGEEITYQALESLSDVPSDRDRSTRISSGLPSRTSSSVGATDAGDGDGGDGDGVNGGGGDGDGCNIDGGGVDGGTGDGGDGDGGNGGGGVGSTCSHITSR
jgi:hypothetical protein